MLYENPQAMHALLDKLAQSVTSYLNGQITAGAQAVQIFDSWGGSLSAAAYQEFSLAYMRKIVDGLIREHDGRRVPVILFTKGGGLWLESMADAGAEALGLDWTCDIGEARRRVGDKVALQGNMDPSVLYAKPDAIRAEVARILASFGHGNGHVFNTPRHHAGSRSSPCRRLHRVGARTVRAIPRLIFNGSKRNAPHQRAFCIAGSVCRLRLRQRTQARRAAPRRRRSAAARR